MERVRTYSSEDFLRAAKTARDVKNTVYREKISRSGGVFSKTIPQRQQETALMMDQMWGTHWGWVTRQFEPRVVALQSKKGAAGEDSIPVRDELKDHYRKGLATAVTMHSRAQPDSFDAQDVIAGYTIDFLSMLKLCERFSAPPAATMRLAQQSCYLDSADLMRGYKEYIGRFLKSTIIDTAAYNPNSFEDRLAELTDRVIALAMKPQYSQLTLKTIRHAVINHKGDPEGHLDRLLSSKTLNDTGEVPANVVFEADKHYRQRSFVPIEIRKAGEALQEAIGKTQGVSEIDIARVLGRDEADIIDFENGELIDLNPQAVYQAADQVGVENLRLLEFYKQTEILNWLRTLAKEKKMTPAKKLGRGIRLLRLASGNTNKEFAMKMKFLQKPKGETLHDAEIKQLQDEINVWENGILSPTYDSLNKIFQTAELSELGENNKVMQYLYLLSTYSHGANKSDYEPMDLATLQKCSFRELMRYLRHLRGATQAFLGEECNYSEIQIRRFERGESVNEGFVEQFIEWLGLDEEQSESALAAILRHKAQETRDKKKKLIAQEIFQGVLTEQYLFKEHIDYLDPYILSEKDEDIQPWLAHMPLGNRILFLRTRKSFNREKFAKQSQIGIRTIYDIEKGITLPFEETVFALADALDYDDFHNPIRVSLYDRLAEERAVA